MTKPRQTQYDWCPCCWIWKQVQKRIEILRPMCDGCWSELATQVAHAGDGEEPKR